jgi:hypothetical protein
LDAHHAAGEQRDDDPGVDAVRFGEAGRHDPLQPDRDLPDPDDVRIPDVDRAADDAAFDAPCA